jgi:uncharacterized protein (TIGR02757 family)
MARPKRVQQLLELKDFLDGKVEEFNNTNFIELDPVSIPHRYKKKQDIEIAGLFAAVLAWGQRVTVINKSKELLGLMDDAPHDFLLNYREKDLRRFEGFKHRTFTATDALYFMHFLRHFYERHESLEEAFVVDEKYEDVGPGLIQFHQLFFGLEGAPARTRKHISTPERKSACKRLNMYLRWMVRRDDKGVDFGIWRRIRPAQLVCPCDVHVERVARKLKLMKSKQLNWDAALELTNNLKLFDPSDPVKYDFALFGLGIIERF